jgi:hypothetical protein
MSYRSDASCLKSVEANTVTRIAHHRIVAPAAAGRDAAEEEGRGTHRGRAPFAGQRQHPRIARLASAITTTGADSRLSWRTLSRALASARLSAGNRVLGLYRKNKNTDQMGMFGVSTLNSI